MNVLVCGNLPDDIMARISAVHDVNGHPHDHPMDRSDLLAAVTDAHGLVCMITDTIDAPLLTMATRLKMIANFGVGYNNIDVDAATARGIMVSNTPGVLTDATADLAMALILGIGRRIVEADRHTRDGKFRFWAPFYFLGHEVSGKTLGIIGLGRIGRAVARRAAGFKMNIIYHNRRPIAPEQADRLGVRYASLNDLLETADFISLHMPLTSETHHMIGSDELVRMKSSAYLINTARGPVVDEAALVESLQQRRLAGAGLDVYEHEPALTPGLIDLPNVVLLPHVGSATLETRRRMANLAVDNLLIGLTGKLPPNCINARQLGIGSTV
jgi:glyoxylate reductase